MREHALTSSLRSSTNVDGEDGAASAANIPMLSIHKAGEAIVFRCTGRIGHIFLCGTGTIDGEGRITRVTGVFRNWSKHCSSPAAVAASLCKISLVLWQWTA